MRSKFQSFALGLALATLAGGCVISSEPALGPEDRVVPFESGTRFQTYERERPDDPWKPKDETLVFAADADGVIREVDDSGKPKDDSEYSLYPLGADRYLAQARFGDDRVAYGALEVRDGEGVLTVLECARIDANVLQDAGVTVKGEDCDLDTAADPVGVLKRLARHPAGGQFRYVPVQAK